MIEPLAFLDEPKYPNQTDLIAQAFKDWIDGRIDKDTRDRIVDRLIARAAHDAFADGYDEGLYDGMYK